MILYEIYYDNQQAYEDFDKGSRCFSDLELAKRFYESCDWEHVILSQYNELNYYNTKQILAEKTYVIIYPPDCGDYSYRDEDYPEPYEPFTDIKIMEEFNNNCELLRKLKQEIENN